VCQGFIHSPAFVYYPGYGSSNSLGVPVLPDVSAEGNPCCASLARALLILGNSTLSTIPEGLPRQGFNVSATPRLQWAPISKDMTPISKFRTFHTGMKSSNQQAARTAKIATSI
jgi:hypothetical protein